MLLLLVCALPILVESTDYIDLGRGFDENTQYWITSQPFKFTRKKAERKSDGTWYAENEFSAAEHGGTHLDAPYHFYKEGWKIGDIPLTNLIVPAVLMDVSSEVNNNADFELKPHHIKIWEEDHGPLPDESVLIIKYGWGVHYNNRTKYFGLEGPRSSRMHFPGMAADAAEYIVKQRHLVGVATDTPSVDTGKSTIYPAHVWLQGANIYIIENLDLQNELPDTDFKLIVMPMKIIEGTGAPCRVVAMMNSSPPLIIATALLMIPVITRFL